MMNLNNFRKVLMWTLCFISIFAISACSFGAGKTTGSEVGKSAGSAGADSDSFIFWNQTGTEGTLAFATEDMEGNEVTSEDFKDAKLILVNYWEPWCGPCVSEMPDLEKLYEKYRNQGLMILGVFSATDMDEDAKSILTDSGTSYPILRANRQFMPFMTGYYPTSFFTDGNGRVLSEEPIIGAQSYDDWDRYINSFLNIK